MSEKISEYIDVVKERFRNPLFANFILSWLLINWKIPYLTLFVNEKSLGGETKLEAIMSIIYDYAEYRDWKLWIFPLLSALCVIGIYPAIFNLIEIIRLRYQKWLKEIHEKWNGELIPIKAKYENLERDKNQFDETILKDLKYSLYHFDNKLERLFCGMWIIEIYHEKKPVQTYDNCYFKNGTFCSNESVLLYINDFQEHNKNQNRSYSKALYFVTIIINNVPYKYDLNLNSRSIFEINWTEDRNRKIRFHWKGVND